MGVAGVMLGWGSGRRGVGLAGFLPAVGGLGVGFKIESSAYVPFAFGGLY